MTASSIGRTMARKEVIRIGGDVREHPRYSVDEAAKYRGIPCSTRHSWVLATSDRKPALINLADEEKDFSLSTT